MNATDGSDTGYLSGVTRSRVLPDPDGGAFNLKEIFPMARMLIVLTSHSGLGDTGNKTGFHYEEMTTPYYALIDAGHDVDIASIRGGKPPADPNSLDEDEAKRPASLVRFLADKAAMAKLTETHAIAEMDPDDYDGIYLPGGHGTMWDFPDSKPLARTVGAIFDRGGVVSAICHGPAGLVGAKRADGKPVVDGLRINSFTDSEEKAAGLDSVVPFLLETRLKELGARFEGGANFTSKTVRDGQLITGQNPQSAQSLGKLLVEALREREAKAA